MYTERRQIHDLTFIRYSIVIKLMFIDLFSLHCTFNSDTGLVLLTVDLPCTEHVEKMKFCSTGTLTLTLVSIIQFLICYIQTGSNRILVGKFRKYNFTPARTVLFRSLVKSVGKGEV